MRRNLLNSDSTCGADSAIACSSALTEMIQGRRVEEARKLSNLEVVERLGGLPENKVKCSLVAEEAIRTALP